MIVLGVDPGLAATGYGVVDESDEGELNLVSYGVIKTASDLSIPERLRIIYKDLTDLTLLHKPDSSAVEKLFFQRNIRTAMSVGQARGVAILALANLNLGVYEYTPLEIKQAVTGYGNAEKNQVQMMVKTLLNLRQHPKPDDAADALAVAICHIHSINTKQIYLAKKE